MNSNETVPEIEAALNAYRGLVQLMSGVRPTEFVEASVTMAQMKVLMLLSVSEARMSDLATTLHLSLSTISGLVERLVEHGLASRRTHPDDRRQVIVSLTVAGSDFLDRFQELGISHLRELLSLMPPADVTVVRDGLELLIKAAQQLPKEDHS
jgi:DNA-binding MarR family transcriptional regulator